MRSIRKRNKNLKSPRARVGVKENEGTFYLLQKYLSISFLEILFLFCLRKKRYGLGFPYHTFLWTKWFFSFLPSSFHFSPRAVSTNSSKSKKESTLISHILFLSRRESE